MTIKYQFFTSVLIWYQLFTRVRIWYQFFTCVCFDTNVSHVIIWYRLFTRVRIWYRFFIFVEIWNRFFTSEKNRYSYSHVKKYKIIWNLSTNFTSQNLSKLTIRKFHICQKWRIGANSSHVMKLLKCEIYEVWNLRSVKFTKFTKCEIYEVWNLRSVKFVVHHRSLDDRGVHNWIIIFQFLNRNMFWILKRTVSMRMCFWAPIPHVKNNR